MKKISLLFVLFTVIFLSCDNLNKTQTKNNNETLSIIPFSNDNLRFGLVDLNGEVIVDNEWENPSSIAIDGIVSVKNKDGYYEFYTATSNPKKIGVEYKDVTLFSEGLAAVVNEQGFIHYIDVQGNIKFELSDDGKGGLIQKAGAFSEGLARFQNSENLWGFINMEGEIVIKPRYDFVRSFNEGLAYVERYNKTANERSIGFIDQQDLEVIPLTERYTAFSDFQDGLAACTDKDGKNQWGYINMVGDRVIEINKTRVSVKPFQNGNAAFFDGLYWGLIDEAGKIVVNPKYDALLSYYNNGLAPYKNSSKEIGFINSSREDVIKCQYEDILPFFSSTTVVKDKYYVFIDKQGNSVSNVYLKYIPIKSIIAQYTGLASGLVNSLYINVSSIANTIIPHISSESINDLSFNSSVKDVMSYYKIPLSGLPNNSYQKEIQHRIGLSGNLKPFKVKIKFSESIYTQSSESHLIINDRAKIKSIEFRVSSKELDSNQQTKIIDEIIAKIETAGFVLDSGAAESSWKANSTFYRLGRTTLEINSNKSEFNIIIDYSEYY